MRQLSPRIRGRRGRRIREQVKQEEPLCLVCLANGIVKAAEEVDHIVPLHLGGTNELTNMQGLCRACHDIKTNNKPRIGPDGYAV